MLQAKVPVREWLQALERVDRLKLVDVRDVNVLPSVLAGVRSAVRSYKGRSLPLLEFSRGVQQIVVQKSFSRHFDRLNR